METSQQPFNSYKKENMDLKPDDRPWISILTNKGNYTHYQLAVMDRITALYHFRGKHQNDSRYPELNRTNRFDQNSTLEYTHPHIRIEKTFPVNMFEFMQVNKTVNFT